jgi:hypothetical protein
MAHREVRHFFARISIGLHALRGTEVQGARSPASKGSTAMRKAIAELDAEQRAQLLYIADLGTAMLSSALVVCILKAIVDLFGAA